MILIEAVVNGMAYGRGSAPDFDAWEELGNPGWGWDGILPYFKKSTTFQPPEPATVEKWNITVRLFNLSSHEPAVSPG